MRIGKNFTLSIACLAIAAMLAAGSAHADTVTFHTTGTFSGADFDSSLNGGAGGLRSGGSTLIFNGAGNTNASGLFNVVSLGMFTLSSTTVDPSFDTFLNDTFTLNIVQTSPIGLGSSQATVLGEVSSTTGGVLVLSFTPGTITLGPATYTIPPSVSVPFPTAANPSGAGNATIQGQVAVTGGASTPAPAAVWGGMGLFGIIGASRRRRVTTGR